MDGEIGHGAASLVKTQGPAPSVGTPSEMPHPDGKIARQLSSHTSTATISQDNAKGPTHHVALPTITKIYSASTQGSGALNQHAWTKITDPNLNAHEVGINHLQIGGNKFTRELLQEKNTRLNEAKTELKTLTETTPLNLEGSKKLEAEIHELHSICLAGAIKFL